jgi:hypothetical protein
MRRRQAARGDRHGGGPIRDQMRGKLVSIGDDIWIENQQGKMSLKWMAWHCALGTL